MLRPGGILVYSTCTFSVEENEDVISDFLKAYEEFSMEHTMRMWPHKIVGEGHFIAKLKKSGGLYETNCTTISENTQGNSGIHQNTEQNQSVKKYRIGLCRAFLAEELGLSMQLLGQFTERGVFLTFGEHLYLMPVQMIPVKGLKVVRPGLHLGTVKKNRFEPSHSLALYLSQDDVRQSYEMNEKEIESYLHGDTFPCDAKLKGWTLLTTGGYSIGFGKAGNGQMKNHYPRGLRG